MSLLTPVTQRHRQPEIMDQPDIDPGRFAEALQGLERINWWSGSAGILWPPIRDLARKIGSRSLSILDIATGAGDLPIRLRHKARRAGLDVEIEGCDRSPHAIAHARWRAEENKAAVPFFQWDALEENLPDDYDIVICSLFLHHLEEVQAIDLLKRMTRAAKQMVLVNDLVRSRLGFALAYLGTRVLSASAVVHTDGPRSVEAAFTIAEVRALAERAGMDGVTVVKRWPCRYLLKWQRPSPSTPGEGRT